MIQAHHPSEGQHAAGLPNIIKDNELAMESASVDAS